MRKLFLLFFCFFSLISCNKDNNNIQEPIVEDELYFPPITFDGWASVSPESLSWESNKINDLYDFLSLHNTRAFIVLKNGKIVLEKYWGNNIINTSEFGQNTLWYWASAGKSLTSFLVGLAQENGLLDIEDKTSDYLGEHWTNLSLEKENLIKLKNQLTMTTGLDYNISDLDCTNPSCLEYNSDAGSEWFYHNATYTLLEKAVSNAANVPYNQFTDEQLESKIGMSGTWIQSGYNNVYWSSARDAARFGLLILNKGKWGNQQIMKDSNYYNAMINSSQNLNPSYGYLWWLNGKNAIIYPGFEKLFNTSLALDAPEDLIAAMGKNGQFIDVIPSEKLLIIRFGEAPDNSLVPIAFHNEMWKKIKGIIN